MFSRRVTRVPVPTPSRSATANSDTPPVTPVNTTSTSRFNRSFGINLPDSSIDGHESLPDYVSEADVTIDDTPVPTSPPDYSIAASRPTRPVIYTFSDWDENTVLLMPPGRDEELNPLYCISTSLVVHPFVPLAIRMSIRRGGTAPQGAFVGSVEIGMTSREYNKVKVGNRTAKLDTFLTNVAGQQSARHWMWAYGLLNLRWDCRGNLDDGSPLCICYNGNENHQLAILVPPPLNTFPYPPAEPTITVFPDGHGEYFDHVLLSGLAVQKLLAL